MTKMPEITLLRAALEAKDAEIARLENIECRLDLAIAMLPTFDPDGPGDCTDRLVAGVKRLYPAWFLVETARELRDLMQGVIDGEYTPDSFTLQPIDKALATLDEKPPRDIPAPETWR